VQLVVHSILLMPVSVCGTTAVPRRRGLAAVAAGFGAPALARAWLRGNCLLETRYVRLKSEKANYRADMCGAGAISIPRRDDRRWARCEHQHEWHH
jgi:hypothetical protein